jgi:putative isomerase
MDNAARFDHISMLKNGKDAWSASQASVDLNAYLYDEKRDLAELAGALGKDDDKRRWLKEADNLKSALQAQMYDPALGYFFDRKLEDGTLVRIFGPEGWIPLWAGAASPEQARHVAAVIADPRKFATAMPFPSLAADDPRFSPVKGYWRGAVWIDQAYFALTGLRRYGYAAEADALALRLVSKAQGLAAQTPFHEVYDPLTGDGLHAPNFSWSAAHFLMLLQE